MIENSLSSLVLAFTAGILSALFGQPEPETLHSRDICTLKQLHSYYLRTLITLYVGEGFHRFSP